VVAFVLFLSPLPVPDHVPIGVLDNVPFVLRVRIDDGMSNDVGMMRRRERPLAVAVREGDLQLHSRRRRPQMDVHGVFVGGLDREVAEQHRQRLALTQESL
jgi:hypothetical protein